VVSAYVLFFAGFLLLSGRVADLWGRRRTFVAGLAVFTAASLCCGLSVSPEMLVVSRAFQGLGAATTAPAALSIITTIFAEGRERDRAVAAWTAVAAGGGAAGLLLGGFITDVLGWEWIFFVNVPIGLAALAFVPRYVSESRADGMTRHFDTAGAVTVTGSLMLLVYGLTQTTNNGWTSIQTIGALAGSAVLMAAFLWIENRSRSPLVPLGFFRRRTPTAANVIGLGLGTMVFGMFFLLSLYMQQVLGFSALKTGVGYLAVALTAVVASGIAQALVTRLGVKPILAIGMGLLGGGLAYFTQVSPNGSYLGDLLPGFLLIGVGLGFSFVPVSIAALAGVTGKDAGLASGLINTSQQIGGALGLAVLATVSTTRTENLLADGKDPATALTSGFQIAFWVGVGLAAASLVATLVALRRKDLEQVPGEAVPVPA
jgi:EmrB/QacA subfamily drug resistance transporter